MKDLLSRLIAAIILLAIIYAGYVLLSQPPIKLAAPNHPPFYSVNYVYISNRTSPIEIVNINKEIENDIKNIKSAGFEGVKINYHFRGDSTVSNTVAVAAAKNGLYPIGQLVGHDAKPSSRAFTSDELSEWETFVRSEVRKNKDRVYFWEVWNEPNMTALRFRYGTPAEYLELLQKTQKIIKEENPLAKVIVTADYTDTASEIFTNEFLALGGSDYFDYLSFHPYNALDTNSKYDLAETLKQEKELAQKYNKPLWMSEIGYPDSDSSEAHQAELALTLFKAARENNIPIVWFHWSDRRSNLTDNKTGWGLVRQDNSSKPTLENIKAFIQTPTSTEESTTTPADKNPDWIKQLIIEQESSPVANRPSSLTECQYKNQTIYYLPPRCCDISGILYDANGKTICSPDGGMTGNGDGKCPDFFEVRQDCEVIWQDMRK